MTYVNGDSKITTHAALTQNVHGVGANDIADVADISTHAAVTTNVHGTGAGNVIVGSDELGYMAETLVEVSGSRAVDTIYQNTSGNTMIANLSISNNTQGAAVFFYVEAATPPTVRQVLQIQVTANMAHNFTAIIPNNEYYKLAASAGVVTVNEWFEST